MKDIKGYEGLYAITEDGRVWGYKRKKFLTPWVNSNGYYYVDLYLNGKVKKYGVHRLVALTYISNPDDLPEVNHKDCDKFNNNVSNLEWCSRQYNNTYNNHQEKVAKSVRKKVYCVELDKTFNSLTEAANELKICAGNISKCCQGKLKTTGGYHWQYV